VQCLFYVLGEDEPRFTLNLPFCPARGLVVRHADRSWVVSEVEMRVEADRSLLQPGAHVVVWLTALKSPIPS